MPQLPTFVGQGLGVQQLGDRPDLQILAALRPFDELEGCGRRLTELMFSGVTLPTK